MREFERACEGTAARLRAAEPEERRAHRNGGAPPGPSWCPTARRTASAAVSSDVHATQPIEVGAVYVTSCAQKAGSDCGDSARRRGRSTDDMSVSGPDNPDE